MRIGIDIDDTLVKTNDYMTEISCQFDKKFGNTGKVLYPKKKYHSKFKWTPEQKFQFYQCFFDEYYQDIPLLTDALNVLKNLKQRGHELVIITARGYQNHHIEHSYEKNKQWLDEKQIPYDQLIVDAKYKGPICEANHIDLLIDDSYGQCSFVAKHNQIPVFWFTKEVDQPLVQGMQVVSSWKEVQQQLLKIERGLL